MCGRVAVLPLCGLSLIATVNILSSSRLPGDQHWYVWLRVLSEAAIQGACTHILDPHWPDGGDFCE